MKENVYRKYLSEEQINNMKASEIRDFRKQEESITNLAITYLLWAFVMFVLLVAMILWFNKLTIFLFVIALPLAVLFGFSYFKMASEYKKKLKEYAHTNQ